MDKVLWVTSGSRGMAVRADVVDVTARVQDHTIEVSGGR